MTDKFDRDNSEFLESERQSGVSSDHQWGTGVNQGEISHNDMEDQLKEDIGINNDGLLDEAHGEIADGDLHDELREDIGLTNNDEGLEPMDK